MERGGLMHDRKYRREQVFQAGDCSKHILSRNGTFHGGTQGAKVQRRSAALLPATLVAHARRSTEKMSY